MQGPVRSRNFALIEKQIGFFREPEIEISTNFQLLKLATFDHFESKHIKSFSQLVKNLQGRSHKEKKRKEGGGLY